MKKISLLTILLFLSLFLIAEVKDIPFTKYSLSQASCNGLLFKSGSRIYIPENAFTFLDGSACNGEIKIKYREIRSKLDMLISKTPMIYEDEKGNKNTLESAGMFEIYAEANNKPLKLKDGKQIQVRFAIENNLDDIEGFILDKKDSVWRKINNKITDFGIQTNSNDIESLWGAGSPPVFEQFSTYDEWGWEDDCWCDEFDEDFIEYREKETKVFKALNVNEMGMYNYDRILKEDDRVPIIASFELKNRESEINKIYVAYEGINSLLYFTKYDFDKNFGLLPGCDFTMFAISKDGSVAILPEEEKEKINLEKIEGKEYTFKLELQELIPENREELALATNLK